MESLHEQARILSQRMHALFEDIPTDDPEVIRMTHRIADWGCGSNLKFLDDLEGFISVVFQAAFKDVLGVIKESSEQTHQMIKTSDKRALRKLVEFIRRETIHEIIGVLESESEKKLKCPDVHDSDIVRTDSPLSVQHKHLSNQIDRLGNCILKHFSREIGMGDPVHGEGACDVAVRLLERYAGTLEETKEAGA